MIRESQYAGSKPDFIHKLTLALKEANETEYWLDLLAASECLESEVYSELTSRCKELMRMLISSIKTRKGKPCVNKRSECPRTAIWHNATAIDHCSMFDVHCRPKCRKAHEHICPGLFRLRSQNKKTTSLSRAGWACNWISIGYNTGCRMKVFRI